MRSAGRSVKGRVALLAAVATAAGALAIPSAEADHTMGHCALGYAYHPSDPSYACQWWHTWLRACDRQVDGHKVRAWYEGSFGPGQPRPTGWAPSGGCIDTGTMYGSGLIVRFRICVEAEGCSAYRRP